VFLEDFADTDDEVELGSSDEERAIRREERKKAKGKSKATYNPLAPTTSSSTKIKSVKFPSEPTAAPALPKDAHLLDPNIDPSLMAPSTLVLALRKKRREQKRLARDQVLRSTLRASTLKTEEEILERERLQKEGRPKGKRAQHETGQIKVVKRLTQDELIAAALEEEERNKEALRDWVRKEEERRELRRVGRKRVVGPRWTWVTRTVGKLVEEVEEAVGDVEAVKQPEAVETVTSATTPEPAPAGSNVDENEAGKQALVVPAVDAASAGPKVEPPQTALATDMDTASSAAPDTPAPAPLSEAIADQTEVTPRTPLVDEPAPTSPAAGVEPTKGSPVVDKPAKAPSATAPTPPTSSTVPEPISASVTESVGPPASAVKDMTTQPSTASKPPETVPATASAPAAASTSAPEPVPAPEAPAQYTRNYIILSEIPGGLAAELRLILGDHVEWDQVKYIPHRNRPISA
jgi:hypothetical protein